MTVPDDVEALLAEHSDEVAALTRRARAVLLDGHPELRERVRRGWHSINYAHPDAGFVCALFPLAGHVQLVFERGVLLPDPERRLVGTGRTVRSLELSDATDADLEVVVEYLDQAIALGRRPARA
ncbi:DUF1801 domain-containing protein [Modestobacter sp. I12A-02662]|uniref:DUF1801 domain-containing protein n=1 Tax=Modestobacter sp. I12A-02662 TaxID=1730496 RepID=UPI0034DFF408